MNPARRNIPAIVLFAIYAIVLIGIILFKYPFSYQHSVGGRVLNLIPLAGSFASDGTLRFGEVGDNILIFVPFGIYVGLLKSSWPFGKKLLPIVITTVAFEVIQYIFAIGRSDITDVLTNTLGGIIGIGIYALLARILGKHTNRTITVAAAVLTVLGVLFFLFLLAKSR